MQITAEPGRTEIRGHPTTWMARAGVGNVADPGCNHHSNFTNDFREISHEIMVVWAVGGELAAALGWL